MVIDVKGVEMLVVRIDIVMHLILKKSMMVVVFKEEDKEEITLSMITSGSRG